MDEPIEQGPATPRERNKSRRPAAQAAPERAAGETQPPAEGDALDDVAEQPEEQAEPAPARPPSPRVLALSWGRMEIEGLGAGRDFKLYPGGGRAWDWTETNTHHIPGIQPADVLELLERGATVIVLSRGLDQVLQTAPATIKLLQERGVPFYIEETRAAVQRYNRLAESEAVGGLFHSTC